MGDLISAFSKLLLDKSKSLGIRSALVVSIFGIIILIDLGFSFSYNIHISKKLENLERINKLKVVYKNDSATLGYLSRVEKEVFQKGHYSEFSIFDFQTRLKAPPPLGDSLETTTNDTITKDNMPVISLATETKTSPIPRVSRFWMIVSSNAALIVINLFSLIGVFFMEDDNRSNILLLLVFIIIVSIGLMFLSTWLFSLIPIILNRPYLNYTLNFIIQGLIMWAVFRKV